MDQAEDGLESGHGWGNDGWYERKPGFGSRWDIDNLSSGNRGDFENAGDGRAEENCADDSNAGLVASAMEASASIGDAGTAKVDVAAGFREETCSMCRVNSLEIRGLASVWIEVDDGASYLECMRSATAGFGRGESGSRSADRGGDEAERTDPCTGSALRLFKAMVRTGQACAIVG